MILEATDYSFLRGVIVGIIIGVSLAYKYYLQLKDKKSKSKKVI